MNRLFCRHRKRNVRSLDGFWKFKTDPQTQGVEEKWYEYFPADHRRILVPSCWNTELELYHYEGVAWYSTEFTAEKERLNLVFYGFTGQMDVFVDGKEVDSCYGGYAGFEVLVQNLTPGPHTLTVAVDNTHNSQNTIPLARVDWFHYGGLFRGVELMELEEVWIKDCSIDYVLDASLNNVELSIEATLQAFNGTTERDLTVYVNDTELCTVSAVVNGETTIHIPGMTLEHVRLWSDTEPNLYTFRLAVDEDDIQERIGFRHLAVEDGKLLLNKQPITLKGINRHEDHPDWGFAVPLQLMKKDLDIIGRMGCNTIRGSHYPNHPIFLDLLDEEGMLFWEEIPMWGFPEHALQDPHTLERGLAMHEAMVRRDRHHPSIILWGMHNEIDTRTQAAYDLTERFVQRVKGMDVSRPLTYATNHPLEDICLSLVDVVSVNKYFGWYGDRLDDWDQFLDDLKTKMRSEGLTHMPIIISEFGAGAIYGQSTFEGPKWTENYQSEYLGYTLELFAADPDVIGTYVWQYCDIRTARELELGRPRSFNNKGIVDEYRRPKQGFWKVQEMYRGE